MRLEQLAIPSDIVAVRAHKRGFNFHHATVLLSANLLSSPVSDVTLKPKRRRRVCLSLIPPLQISAWIARGAQSNMKLLTEGLRKAGLPE
jgi:hypothetical protein